jgi:hypothetical protein
MSAQEDAEFEFDLRDELLGYIAHRTGSDERTLQTSIGPSGMGTPCNRKLAYRLAEIPAVHTPLPDEEAPDVETLIRRAAWRPTVGKAVHLWLAEMLEDLNRRELASKLHEHESGDPCRARWCDSHVTNEHTPRYAVEFETPVGTIGGVAKDGHIDVYDRMRQCVIDWKIVGPKSLKDKRAQCSAAEDPNPGQEYRVQAHVYAAGVARAQGWDVQRVAVCFLPMNGELKDGFVWSEPYNPEIRAQAFARARGIFDLMRYEDETVADPELVDETLPTLKTAPDYCHRCDWFVPGVERASAKGCPGDPSLLADTMDSSRDFSDLMG